MIRSQLLLVNPSNHPAKQYCDIPNTIGSGIGRGSGSCNVSGSGIESGVGVSGVGLNLAIC